VVKRWKQSFPIRGASFNVQKSEIEDTGWEELLINYRPSFSKASYLAVDT
jgi:hypothetical protein